MLFAIDENNIKHEPRPNLHKETPLFCPSCKTSVLSKCGSEKIWHFSHKSTKECDSWSESDPWHLNWQALFPKEQVEIVMGNHRADVVSTGGVVIEFQHSYLSSDEAKEREDFYQNMIWVFDAVEPWQNGRLWESNVDTNKNKRIKSFNWEKPKSFIKENYIHYPLLIDIGNDTLIIVLYKSQANPGCFNGIYISHSNFIKRATSLKIKEAIVEFTDHSISPHRYQYSRINLNELFMPEYFAQKNIILKEIKLIQWERKAAQREKEWIRENIADIRKDIKKLKNDLSIYRHNLFLESFKDEIQQVGTIRQQISDIKFDLVRIQIAEASSKIQNIRQQIRRLRKELINFRNTNPTIKESLKKQWLAEWLERVRKERLHKSQATTRIYTQQVDESKLPPNVREEYLKLCSEAQSNGWHVSWVIYKCTQHFGKDFEKCVKEQTSTVASE